MEVDQAKDCIVALFQIPSPCSCSSNPDISQLVTCVLSQLGPKGVGSCSAHILQTTLKETLELAIASLQTSSQRDDPSTHPANGPGPWCTLSRLLPTAHHGIQDLRHFSAHLCTILSTHLQVATPPTCPCDLTALLTTFSTTWDEQIFTKLTQVITQLKLDSDRDWCRCLATVCVCLVASEVWHVVRGRREGKWEWLHGRELLGSLDQQFPSALYCKYQQWEEQEVGGAGQLVELAEGGVVFKSVEVLVSTLSIIATVARGCGHQQLTSSVVECSLRLVSRSWQHIQQLWKQELPVYVHYAVLSSLLHLHAFLRTLSSSQEGVCTDLLMTLRGQISAVKERLVHYHTQLSITCILQDSQGGGSDWQNSRPFLEGERCSYTVHMWGYLMRGLQHDLHTYLSLDCFLLREEILAGVVGACLSHLASRYSQTCPSPQRVGLVLADILVILTCVASILPHLHTLREQAHTSPALSSIHASCRVLLLVGGVVTSSLQQLELSLTSSPPENVSKGSEDVQWLEFLETYQESLYEESSGARCAHLILPLHGSQYGFLLQALLSEDGALCMELYSREEEESEEVLHLLEVLVRCPHTVWALSRFCSELASRETEDNALSDLPLLQVCAVKTLLRRHLGPLLCSLLLTKAASFHGNKQSQDVSVWCKGLLNGLQELLHVHLRRPLQALLHYMSGGTKEGATSRLAKILVSTLTGCGLVTDSSHHPCHSMVLPTVNALCFALGANSLSTSLPSHIHQVMERHADYHRHSLRSLLAPPTLPPTPSDPLTLASEELSQCTLAEHTIAAEVITSDGEGLQALQTVHSVLRKRQTGCSGCGFTLSGFDPMKEYQNMATLGTNRETLLSQQNLMMASDQMDMTSVLERGGREAVLTLLKTVRWEWHVEEPSELTSAERELVDKINDAGK